jgi:fused signal recognition particle receptor
MPAELTLTALIGITLVLLLSLYLLWRVYQATVGRRDDAFDATVHDETVTPTIPDGRQDTPVDSAPERLRQKLAATRQTLAGFGELFRSGVDDSAWEQLEELLISVDVGVTASTDIVAQLQTEAKRDGITDADGLRHRLKRLVREQLITPEPLARRANGPTVWLVAGVNGAGKTTTIGKLAAQSVAAGETVVLGAADTFRAAASEQLGVWASRTGAQLVARDPGADPGAVAYETYELAEQSHADIVIVDTAGRLQNHRELMDELGKVKRVLEKKAGPIDEVLLVIDATTGQNGIAQARAFTDAVNVTGIVLTKLDGSAKGGIVVAVQRELGIPVKLVGLGEDIADLAVFDPTVFVDGLFAGVTD